MRAAHEYIRSLAALDVFAQDCQRARSFDGTRHAILQWERGRAGRAMLQALEEEGEPIAAEGLVFRVDFGTGELAYREEGP